MNWPRKIANVDGGIVGVYLELAVHGGDGAEKQIADVGEDGGTARRDTILREKEQEFGENVVDIGGRGELGGFAGESGAEIAY
jgi:hypothetical protein